MVNQNIGPETSKYIKKLDSWAKKQPKKKKCSQQKVKVHFDKYILPKKPVTGSANLLIAPLVFYIK